MSDPERIAEFHALHKSNPTLSKGMLLHMDIVARLSGLGLKDGDIVELKMMFEAYAAAEVVANLMIFKGEQAEEERIKHLRSQWEGHWKK
jgi:hypothetical protein